jgi:glycosyltransferase involved in cell wall biosynthesis
MVVGEGDFEAQLSEAVSPDRVTRVGWVDHEEMPRYVSAFDALPLTYDTSTPCYFSPLKLPEAMACGVVPVVPEVGDLPAIVTHEANGLLYPAGDVVALANAVQWLSEHPAQRAAMAREALQTARDSPWVASAAYALGLDACEVKSS